MKAKREAGVTRLEPMHFCSADLFAKQNLLYVLWGCTYLVDKPYEVKRSYMNAFMLQYIISGELHFEIGDVNITAKAGELVLLDCKEPHRYWAEQPAQVKWFHFNGAAAQPLVQYIYERNQTGCVDAFSAKKVLPYIDRIMELIRLKDADNFQISHNIYSILCELCAMPQELSSSDSLISEAVSYMNEHFEQAVSVADIAAHTGLSVYYFTRLFKRLMRVSPHAYLTQLRMNKAKNLLVYTYYSVEEIAAKAGFQSASHFIRAFKKDSGITPKKFREYSKGTR